MAKVQRIKERAARDLFSVSLDLDLIDFKLNNIIDDLEEGRVAFELGATDSYLIEEAQQAKDLKERARTLRKLCESVRIGWEHEK